jgi:hypothetical protein
VGVTAGHGVSVEVEGGRDAAMIQAAGDDDEWDAGHSALSQERFGHPVRIRGGSTTVVAEHEGIGPSLAAALGGVIDEDGERGQVEIDDVATPGLGGCQFGTVGSFDPAGAERHPAGGQRHVVPAQAEELGSSRAGQGGQRQQDVELRVSLCDVVEEVAQLGGRRGRNSRVTVTMRWARSAGLSQIHPQRIAWENAARKTMWTRADVPAASGRPLIPPHRRSWS